ncbi:MAG: hypothetical protein KIT58_24490 [Planctomycetota bacterium]|nr:hypothetical protein [Planctomycetota bacterium]
MGDGESMEFTEEEVYGPSSMEFTEEEAAWVYERQQADDVVALGLAGDQLAIAVTVFDGPGLVRLCRSTARWVELRRRTRVEEVEHLDSFPMFLLGQFFPTYDIQVPTVSAEFEAAVDAKAKWLLDGFLAEAERGPVEACQRYKDIETLRERAKASLQALFAQVNAENTGQQQWAAWTGTAVATAKLACDVVVTLVGDKTGIPGAVVSGVYGLADAGVSAAYGDPGSIKGASDMAAGVGLSFASLGLSVAGESLAEASKIAQLLPSVELFAEMAMKANLATVLDNSQAYLAPRAWNAQAAADSLRAALGSRGRLLPLAPAVKVASKAVTVVSLRKAVKSYVDTLRNLDTLPGWLEEADALVPSL